MINDIRKGFDEVLIALPNVPQYALENTKLSPGKNPWMRSTLLPSRSQPASWGDGVKLKLIGIYQVDVFYPIGNGTDDISIVLNDIMQAFYPGTVIGSAQVTNISQLPGSTQSNMSYMTSIQIEYITYMSKA